MNRERSRRHANQPQLYGPLPAPLMKPIHSPSPIPPDRIGPSVSMEFVPRIKRIREEKYDKLVLLAEAYSLDINALRSSFYRRHARFWEDLARCLADDFVPGFRVVETKPGRPPKNAKPGPLYDEVASIVRDGVSIAEACRRLQRRKGPWHAKSPEALETQFHREKSRRRALAHLMASATATEE